MTKPRVYKTEAIILKRSNLGEADIIVTLYTPNFGKIRAVAKGARKPKSKLGGHLDLLTRSALLLAQGQNLDVVTQAQAIESILPLRKDLERTSCGIYIAELVNQFTPEHVENYGVYRLLGDTLVWLCESRSNELVLRYFELHLMSHLGYKPELQRCISCRSSLTQSNNMFSASGGGILCPDCNLKESMARLVSVDAIKVMRYLLSNNSTEAAKLRINSTLSYELEQLMREFIRYHLEREVKSLDLLDRLRGESGSTK